MATRLRTGLIVVVVVLAAYTGAAWLIGIKVQGQLARYEQQALAKAPYLVQAGREYHRGIFGATEEVTYRLAGPFASLSRTLATGGIDAPLQLTVRNTIHHGPLPQFRSVALATLDTQLVLPAAIGSKLNAVFAGRPPVPMIHVRMNWLGGRTTSISIPAFRAQLPAGATIVSQALNGSGTATRNLGSIAAQVNYGGLEAQGPKGNLGLGATRFDANLRQVFDSIYVGDIDASLASLSARGVSGAPFVLTGLSINSTSKADSEFVDYRTHVAADSMNAGSFTFSHIVYDLRLLHLEGTSLAGLTQAMRRAQAGAGSGGAVAVQADLHDALSQYGVGLLVHDPVIQIQSLAFAMPEGEFHLAASLSAHGIRREDLAGGAAGMLALVRFLEAAVDLRIDDPLLSKLLASTARGPALSAQLDSLEKQGYLKRDGKAWTAQIALRAGKLTINGQPYPPTGGP